MTNTKKCFLGESHSLFARTQKKSDTLAAEGEEEREQRGKEKRRLKLEEEEEEEGARRRRRKKKGSCRPRARFDYRKGAN